MRKKDLRATRAKLRKLHDIPKWLNREELEAAERAINENTYGNEDDLIPRVIFDLYNKK